MSLNSVIKYFKNDIADIDNEIIKLTKKLDENNILIRESNLVIEELEKELKVSDRVSPLYKKKTTDKIEIEKSNIERLSNENIILKSKISESKSLRTKLNTQLKIVSGESGNKLEDYKTEINKLLDNYQNIINACAYSDPSRTIIEFRELRKMIDKVEV